MAVYRSNNKKIEDSIRNKSSRELFNINLPNSDFEATKIKYESRYKNIERLIRDGKYSISDPEFIANTGLSIGRRFLMKAQIEGKVGTLSDLWKKDTSLEYKSISEDNKEKIEQNKIEEGFTYKSQDWTKDSISSRSRIYIIDTENADLIELQWVPRNLINKVESRLNALLSVGRNNPFYHYSGSEDTLEFTIDWTFTNDETRKEALKSARWLESLSKADGYETGLHRVMLVWGSGVSGIFSDQLFLVENASYEMGNWVDFNLSRPGSPGRRQGLLPQTIKQEVSLKRVTDFNLKHEDIRYGDI